MRAVALLCSDCFLSDSKGKTFLLRTRKTFRVLVNSNGSSGQYMFWKELGKSIHFSEMGRII